MMRMWRTKNDKNWDWFYFFPLALCKSKFFSVPVFVCKIHIFWSGWWCDVMWWYLHHWPASYCVGGDTAAKWSSSHYSQNIHNIQGSFPTPRLQTCHCRDMLLNWSTTCSTLSMADISSNLGCECRDSIQGQLGECNRLSDGTSALWEQRP